MSDLHRLSRWVLGCDQPEPYCLDLDHPAQDDIAWAADRIKHLEDACYAALQALDTYAAMYRSHMTVQLYSARAGLRDVLQNVDTLRGAKAKQTNHEKEMYRLLVWADALMRSMSGWPENHPNEYIEWKEDWRKLLEGN